jgi:hypothetical protein
MLDQAMRTAILSLRAKGHGICQIARALQISRGAVRTVLTTGNPTVPRIERAEKAEPYRDQILDWVDRCRGNLVRVHEELVAQGLTISYPALTAFCRRHGIGREPPAPVEHYDFHPAQEMQHDTSPHRALMNGVEQRIETASLVLCYSRMLRAQYHHRQETALAWRIKQARLPEAWTIESFAFKRQPGVNPKQIRALAELEFVAKAENLVFIGHTGVGRRDSRPGCC